MQAVDAAGGIHPHRFAHPVQLPQQMVFQALGVVGVRESAQLQIDPFRNAAVAAHAGHDGSLHRPFLERQTFHQRLDFIPFGLHRLGWRRDLCIRCGGRFAGDDRLDLDLATPGDARRAPLPHREIFAALEVGTDLLIDDGKVRLCVESCGPDFAETRVVAGGAVSNRKGVNVPSVVLPLSALTEKDHADLRFGLELGVDWVALSFVQRAEDVVEIKNGVKRTTERKFFPGYVLVEMEMNDESWHLVKSTPKVTGFVGGTANKPTPISEKEVEKIMQQMQDGVEKPRPKVLFEPGEVVRVKEGPFTDFHGSVEHVNYEKNRLRVSVTIFGRATPVELEFGQVEKA